MRGRDVFVIAGFLAMAVGVAAVVMIIQKNIAPRTIQQSEKIISKNMKLSSPAFGHNQPIPAVYTCDGQNVNPPLEIFDEPAGAKSLALIVDDPDAPRGDWVHWLVWNIAPGTSRIHENSVPAGAVQGMTDFGSVGYGGPCPPSGAHRYQFKLYALDETLDLQSSARKAELERAMRGHVLDQAMLVGVYQRKK